MSVIVKGMKMPKKCSFCRCICGGGAYPSVWRCGLTDKTIENYGIRDKNCPLGELPEKHGRLIDAPVKYGNWIDGEGIFECSICSYSFENEGYKHYFNFCPCCGAEMREGQE